MLALPGIPGNYSSGTNPQELIFLVAEAGDRMGDRKIPLVDKLYRELDSPSPQ